MPEKSPSALGLALTFLRSKRGWSKKRLAGALGMGDRSLLSRYERGHQLNRERLEALIAPLGYPPEAVEVLLLADRLISAEPRETAALPAGLSPEERGRIGEAAMVAGWTAAEWVYEELIRRTVAEQAEAARREAEELWARLKAAGREDRRALIAVFPEFRSPALAVRVCAASLRAAAHDAREARALAELALAIGERVPEAEGLRSRTLGYCWAHAGNARRVGNDLDGADEAFARAWELWGAGGEAGSGEAGSGLLPEWKVLSLEASLRRAERRFPEALEALDRARTACGDDRTAAAQILLKKEQVFEVLGDTEGALAALAEAAPLVETSEDLRLRFSLRFKTANNLYHLERYTESAALLPGVRALAVQDANELDLLRVLWLEARVAAGQGRMDEAIAGLEQVRRKFADLGLPYDAALAGLDLAVLWLKAGRTPEVRRLAVEMEAVFRARKVHREALAALALFCDAAQRETATVELARRVIGELERARRSAPLEERPR